MQLPISVCMIVRDEATALPAALASVQPHVAHVVVVDTGSRDATVDIARAAGAHVARFTWIDDFSAARNFAATHASQPWIFVLDADERLTPDSVAALARFLQRAPYPTGTAGSVKRINLAADGLTLLTTESTTRLYPNIPDFAYVNRVHEQLVYRGGAPVRVDTGARLTHSGYDPQALGPKLERNLRILELAGAEADPYLRYQLGRTYQAGGNHAAAAQHLGAALEQLGGTPPETVPYLSLLLLQLGYALLHTRDFAGLFSVLELATDLYPDFTDLYFLYGVALIELGDPARLDDMRQAFETCLALGEPDPNRYESVAGVGSFRAEHNLRVYRELVGRPVADPGSTSVTARSGRQSA